MHKAKNLWLSSLFLISVCSVGSLSMSCQVQDPAQSKKGKDLGKPSGVPEEPKDKNKENTPENEVEKGGNEDQKTRKQLTSSEETRLKEKEVDSRELSRAQLCELPAGSVVVVAELTGNSSGHQKFKTLISLTDAKGKKIDCDLKEGFLWAPHFQVKGEPVVEKKKEEVIIKTSVNEEPKAKVVSDLKVSRFGFVWPTVTQKIRNDSCGGGHYGDPRGERGGHLGTDIEAKVGEPIVAAAAGSLLTAIEQGICGKWMQLTHAENRQTRYCHLNSFVVRSTGTSVERGEKIAVAGKSGNASNPCITAHVHFEVKENGSLVDPEKRLP